MRLTTRLVGAAAACIALAATPPVSAAPFEHSTFHFEFDSTNDCGDGLVLEFHDVVDGRLVVVRHGDGFLYGTQHWTLTAETTIPGTDLTLTVVNKGLVGHDVQVTHNGDGTLTVKVISPARVTVLGPDGRPESHFTGLTIFEQLWDDAGTPEDQTDDVFLEDLSVISHGHSEAAGICEVANRYAP
jgi:hypothetical protein